MKRLPVIVQLLIVTLLVSCSGPLLVLEAHAEDGAMAAAVNLELMTPTTDAQLTSSPTPFQPATLLPSFTPLPTKTQMPSLTPFPTVTATPTATRTLKPVWSRGDLHMHTTCSDGKNTYEEMVQDALMHGYAFIAITDHHVCKEVNRACEKEERLKCFPGMEIALVNRREILAVGVNYQFPDGLTAVQAVNKIHELGGVAIAAHPWAVGYSWDPEELYNSGLDAMECPINGSMPYDSSKLPCTYDSDAHSIETLDPYNSMLCQGRITSVESLLNAIKSRQCVLGH